jgi:hypothetical protein
MVKITSYSDNFIASTVLMPATTTPAVPPTDPTILHAALSPGTNPLTANDPTPKRPPTIAFFSADFFYYFALSVMTYRSLFTSFDCSIISMSSFYI